MRRDSVDSVTLPKETDVLLDELIKGCESSKDILGEHGLLKQLSKRLIERALAAEMTEHLGYPPYGREEINRENTRNGKHSKTVHSEIGSFAIDVPRDRKGTFEPQLVKKRQTRLDGFDEKVLAFYARGLSTREIQEQLEELYGVEVSPTLISNVTDEVLSEVRAWQSRPLSSIYPIIYFDALFVKTRQDGVVKNKAVYLALGINMDGEKELLGLWMNETEGAKFWLSIFNDLKNRGVEDCFIACVDGLKGLPEAIETVFPKTQVQLCIVHKVRNSLRYVIWKERKEVAADLRSIYGASTLDEADLALELFAEKWDKKYPAISRSWRVDWNRLTVFFDYAKEIRKVIYTTNAIESMNDSMRSMLKRHRVFPSDEAVMKVMFLALKRISQKWTRPLQDWKAALNQFVIMFGNRVRV